MIKNLFLIQIILCVCLNAMAQDANQQHDTLETYRLLNQFCDAFKAVRTNAAKYISDQELLEAATKGMVEAVDAYSTYLPANQYAALAKQTSGSLEGIGIALERKKNKLIITQVMPHTPASKAGILRGDKLYAINHKPTKNMSLEKASTLLEGVQGEKVMLSIESRGKNRLVTLRREKIDLRNVYGNFINGVGYIQILDFHAKNTSHLVAQIIRQFQKKSDALKGIVIDLRGNPGGLLEEAAQCANFFLKTGVIVKIQPKDVSETKIIHTTKHTLLPQTPLLILVDEDTASSAEIFAAALQDHKRATIIGQTTFGKGSIQTIFPLGPGHTALRLTTAYYLTPKDRHIHQRGITPDIFMAPTKKASHGDEVRLYAMNFLEKNSHADLH